MCVQKDSHTVYLEQELDSLKVVLEIKNNQLHQKEKKLMEMDKLVGINLSWGICSPVQMLFLKFVFVETFLDVF